jgi:hypothetical protein
MIENSRTLTVQQAWYAGKENPGKIVQERVRGKTGKPMLEKKKGRWMIGEPERGGEGNEGPEEQTREVRRRSLIMLRTLNVRKSPKTEEEKERNRDEIRLNRTLTKWIENGMVGGAEKIYSSGTMRRGGKSY